MDILVKLFNFAQSPETTVNTPNGLKLLQDLALEAHTEIVNLRTVSGKASTSGDDFNRIKGELDGVNKTSVDQAAKIADLESENDLLKAEVSDLTDRLSAKDAESAEAKSTPPAPANDKALAIDESKIGGNAQPAPVVDPSQAAPANG